MSLPPAVEVLIVGAGPVGLTLATGLKQQGIDCLIVDRLAEGANTSRAAVVHAKTLEALEDLSLAETLLQNGLKVTHFCIRDRDRELLRIDFSKIASKYQFVLMIPQNVIEALIARRLGFLGGHVARSCEVTAVRQEEDSAVVAARLDGKECEVRTKLVIGCDGMHSIVREQAGINFEGGSYEESFVLGDVRMEWPIGREEGSLFLSSEGLFVVIPLLPDRFRIIARLNDAPPEPTAADFQKILDERGPAKQRAHVESLVWSSRFHIHHRVAQTLRKGRSIILGDAAHVHSPAGGQGMNTGIQDAVGLSKALGAVVRGAEVFLLDDWAKDRHEIARRVVAMTDRLTRVATVSSKPLQELRNGLLALLGHLPFARQAFAENMAELHND